MKRKRKNEISHKKLGEWSNTSPQTLRNWKKSSLVDGLKQKEGKHNLYISLKVGYALFSCFSIKKNNGPSSNNKFQVLKSNTEHLGYLLANNLICKNESYANNAKECITRIQEVIDELEELNNIIT